MILSRNKLGTPALVLAAATTFVAAACSSGEGAAGTSTPPASDEVSGPTSAAVRVVATTNILADWIENVGGDRVEVFSLLPAGSDPHSYQPGARDVARIAEADLVLSVGLGLEAAWLEELVRNASADESGLVFLGEAVEPIEFMEILDESESAEEHESDHRLLDPHFWFDPLRVKLALDDIATRLSVIDPDGSETYRANAAAYKEQLDELHAWIEQQVGAVPKERRLLVTSHDSFNYFARLYGFEVVGTVIAGTTEADPSAAKIAELVDVVRARGVPAVFGETTASERLANTVAVETGAALVRLYSGSLGPKSSGAETYIDMVRTNVERIVEVLR